MRDLAPCAQRSGESLGREYPEPAHPYRTAFQRDRARIIHSQAFRRLEYKTQVFLNGTGDHLRTRLTHTIEVASISRTLARALGLNEDLAEAIALAHDLGHAPFGHSGEEMLDTLMRGHGGFEHNIQSLRIVTDLERKYPKFDGLNLSFEVREGLKKHQRFYEPPPAAGTSVSAYFCPTLEAQIANLADEITYYSHDLDDGLDAGLLDPLALEGLELWHDTLDIVRFQFPKLKGDALHRYVIRCLIDRMVADVLGASSEAMEKSGVDSVDAVRQQKKALIRYSPPMLKASRALRKHLYANLYYHPGVHSANRNACALLKDVFEAYVANPRLLGAGGKARIRKNGLERAVCDYLAGMTDRYLLEEHAKLFKSVS